VSPHRLQPSLSSLAPDFPRQQVELLREVIGQLPGAEGVEVASVDSFQGRENEAVVISMVRSNATGAVGFLADERRLNVAVTRARRHVALVADSRTVMSNPVLARLLQHVQRVGLVQHAADQ
jgi:superfamily I DNA and/or RNA helicase